MTELYEKSLRKLELDRVLEQLAAYANSDEAKARCLALEPQTDVDEIRVLQEQTGAACRLIDLKGSPSFHELKEIAPSLERADRGGEHFESRPSPGAFVARFALHEHRGDGGGDQHRHVGEHVAGVDQQRQRSGDDGADHFGDEHRGSQPQ